MKRFVCIFLALAAAATVMVCGKTLETDMVFESLSHLGTAQAGSEEDVKDIGTYAADKVTTHYHRQFTDELMPREDYGTLTAFKGDCGKGFGTCYGLMAQDGRIVVDAVYSFFYTEKIGSETYFVLTKAVAPAGDYKKTVANSKGIVVYKLQDGVIAPGNERIIVGSCEDDISGVYDYSGNKLISFPDYFDYADFSHGVYVCTYGSELLAKSLACDFAGNIIFEMDNTAIKAFKNGYAIACKSAMFQDGGSYGIINTKGTWVKSPIYKSIDVTDTGYIMHGRNQSAAYDLQLNYLGEAA